MERRSQLRYQVIARVVFTWEVNGSAFKGVGITRDISLLGVFIFGSACPGIDTTVHLDIFLPPPQNKGTGMRIAAEGRVIRVEYALEDDDVSGFAVASNEFRA
jgi:hypothetical protein